MRRLPEAIINEVRSKSDIVDTISQYMTLTKKGKNYWGVCPFHEDHDPSMSVSPDRQIYKCFVCGAGGNVFSFIQNFENISFVESVIQAASRVQIDLSAYQNIDVKPVDPDIQRMYEALDETQKFTEFQLNTQTGQDAMRKLEARGYDVGLIRDFGIGVALGDNQVYNFLNAKGFEESLLIRADLVRQSDAGIRDVFYQRIMFPIHDPSGRTVAFSARALNDDNNVKYINTSETELYVKGKTLYNFHKAKDHARKADAVLVTEGVTDAIAFTKAGFANVVSLLGVACSAEQVRLLKQCSNQIILAFDGDRAGLEASFNIGKRLREAQCSVSVWYNDSGLDPDDAVRKLGVDTVKKGIDDRLSWLDFVLSYGIGQYGLESFDNRKRVVEFMLNFLINEDTLTQSYYLKKLAEKANFEQSVLAQNLASKTMTLEEAPKRAQRLIVDQNSRFDVTIPERTILMQMLDSKKAAYIFRDELGILVSDLATSFALVILDCYRQKDTIEIADILSLELADKTRKFALELESNDIVETFDEAVLYQNIMLIKRELLKLGVSSLKNQGRQKMQVDEQAKLLEEAINQLRHGNGK